MVLLNQNVDLLFELFSLLFDFNHFLPVWLISDLLEFFGVFLVLFSEADFFIGSSGYKYHVEDPILKTFKHRISKPCNQIMRNIPRCILWRASTYIQLMTSYVTLC